MTDDLVVFLRARLDEDERAARAATPGPWRHGPDKHWRKPGTSWFEEAVFAGPSGKDATCVAGTGETDDPQSMADAAFVARHDPARVLAEVKGKRLILDEYEAVAEGVDMDSHDLEHSADRSMASSLRGALKGLALPYAEHPDYRPEWAPRG